MIDGPNLAFWVLAWLAAALYIPVRHWRTDWGVGLLAIYLINLTVLHWLVPVLYLLPWYEGANLYETAIGTRESAVGLFGLAIGLEIVNGFRHHSQREGREVADVDKVLSSRMVNIYLGAGAFLYIVMSPVAGRFPGLTSIIATGSTLMAVGVGLKCWNAWNSDRLVAVWLWLASAALLPLATVVAQGFLGYGFGAMLIVLAFMASFSRPNWKAFVAAGCLAYVGLSIYVTYMRDRIEIREVVWSGAALERRVDRIAETIGQVEWFDVRNIDHLERIERRLNQSFLVGAAVHYIDGEFRRFAHGETLWTAVIAVVPRALWPDKPVIGGSGNLVSDFTGIRFADGTSVGIGHVMELYVNFGTTGVFFGFVVIGVLLVLADRGAAEHLHGGHGGRFLLWYLPGLCLLQVGGALGEVTGSAAASLLVAAVLNRWTIVRGRPEGHMVEAGLPASSREGFAR